MEFPSSMRGTSRCPFHLSNAPVSALRAAHARRHGRCAACDHIRSAITFALCAASQPSSVGRLIRRRLRIFAGFQVAPARDRAVQPPPRSTASGLSAALLLHRNARPVGIRRRLVHLACQQVVAVLSVEEVIARGGSGHQIQGYTRHCARCWPARVGGRPASKVDDIDSNAHADPGRTGQGMARIATPCFRRSSSRCCGCGGRKASGASGMLPHGWLFPCRGATDPTSTRQINRATHEAAEAAEIRKRVSPDTLRHSWASTHLLEQDVDIRVICGPAGSQQARYDRALCARRD